MTAINSGIVVQITVNSLLPDPEAYIQFHLGELDSDKLNSVTVTWDSMQSEFHIKNKESI